MDDLFLVSACGAGSGGMCGGASCGGWWWWLVVLVVNFGSGSGIGVFMCVH